MIRDIHVPKEGFKSAKEAIDYVEKFIQNNPDFVLREAWPIKRRDGYHPVIIYYHD